MQDAQRKQATQGGGGEGGRAGNETEQNRKPTEPKTGQEPKTVTTETPNKNKQGSHWPMEKAPEQEPGKKGERTRGEPRLLHEVDEEEGRVEGDLDVLRRP